MERLTVHGTELAYEERGSGDETVVLSHSYLVDHSHFAPQIEALAERYRVVAFDHRDHGASARPTSSYEMGDLVDDAIGIIEGLDAAPCHFIGLSTGGFVGMRIALRRPELLRSLVLMDTDARADAGMIKVRNTALTVALRLVGPKPLLGMAMQTMFGPTFLRDPARDAERAMWRERIGANEKGALLRFGHAIGGRDDVLDRLADLDLPVLVVHGADDAALPLGCAQALASTIPGARLEVVPDAGHLCTIEQPEAVTTALVDFLASVGG